MDDVLTQISNEAASPKYAAIRQTCKTASDLLNDPVGAEAYQLRETCLIPLKLALESRNSKFLTCALGGIQNLLSEDRFQSTIEVEDETKWLPMQVLDTVNGLPSMTDETQVEVLKLLLNMTFTSRWCSNAKVMARITEVLVSCYGVGSHSTVRTAARATITQLLSSLPQKMREHQKENLNNGNNQTNSYDENEGEIADECFNAINNELQTISHDLVYILKFLCSKLSEILKDDRKRVAVPLIMDGIHAILMDIPISIRNNKEFLDIIWQDLCPAIIRVLGNPLQDKNVTSSTYKFHLNNASDNKGRGSGCSSEAPAIDINMAKTVYGITGELVRLVCSLQSLRPVIESVLHRMLLYPAPVHRLEALKSLRELLNSPERILDLAGPTISDTFPPAEKRHSSSNNKKKNYNNIAPLKLIVDSLQECSHCNDSTVCITSVNLIGDLVTSLDKLAKGQDIEEDLVYEIHRQFNDLETVTVAGSSVLEQEHYLRSDKSDNDVNNGDSCTDSSDDDDDDSQQERSIYMNKFQTENNMDNVMKPTSLEPSTVEPEVESNREGHLEERGQNIDSENDTKVEISEKNDDTESNIDEEKKSVDVHCESDGTNDSDKCEDEIVKVENISDNSETIATVVENSCSDEIQETSLHDTHANGVEVTNLSDEHTTCNDFPQPANLSKNAAIMTDQTEFVMKDNETSLNDSHNNHQGNEGKVKCENLAFQKRCSNDIKLGDNRGSSVEEQERESARVYVRELIRALPDWLASMYSVEVDEMIQRFASDVCTAEKDDDENGSDNNTNNSYSSGVPLNADGVYVVTYSALSLNLKLIRNGYYESEEKSLHIAEQQFINDLLGTDLMLYLSPYWLSEVFLQTIQMNFLESAGYRDMGREECKENCLIQVLMDRDGLDSRKIGGQFLCSYHDGEDIDRLSSSVGEVDNPLAVQAGTKFAYKILVVCGDAIVDVLSVLINGQNACGITSSLVLMFNAREESRKAREAICTSLEALRTTAKLACTLGVQEMCGAVFQQLAAASCVVEEVKQGINSNKPKLGGISIPSLPNNKGKLVRLHAAHSLSLDLVLSTGLEMGSHSKDCWRHVFQCCAHISELEHNYFSAGVSKVHTTAAKAVAQVKNEQIDDAYTMGYNMDFNDRDGMFPSNLPLEHVTPEINVSELVQQSSADAGWDSSFSSGGVLTTDATSKVLCGLSQAVDRLFDDATNCLNMKALVNFLCELCAASQHQLSLFSKHYEISQVATNVLHLYRLGDVILKCIRGDRPLLHIMLCWSVVAPHLVQAACHGDRSISKKAVTCIHEVVTWLLGNRIELPYFHFNESLCKPYENLLQLELCDGDVQDQIVCSICELVEACTTEIKSGWRPLFAALRAVKIKYTTIEEINEARQRHVTAVLDVFDVFLNTDNPWVFANAAVDCIMCLLKYVRGPSEFEEYADDDSDSGNEYGDIGGGMLSGASEEDLVLPALKYLQQCCKLLHSMWVMPECPIFHSARSIQIDSQSSMVDTNIPGLDLESFQKPFIDGERRASEERRTKEEELKLKKEKAVLMEKDKNELDSGVGFHYPIPRAHSPGKKLTEVKKPNEKEEIIEENISSESEDGNDDDEVEYDIKARLKPLMKYYNNEELITYRPVSLNELDNHTGVLRVWFLVLEGLAGTVTACLKSHQSQTLEMFFDLLKSTADYPGTEFSLYCVNHLLLPTVQKWLRKGNQSAGYWSSGATANFKQCIGLTADLVVEYIVRFVNEQQHQPAVEFMLKQLLDLLTESVAQPVETLSRLGCACIRHSILSCGPMLTERMWQIAVTALSNACDITLYCLRQLMTPFQEDSDNFYGDIGQVKVAVRKECSSLECFRIRQLAQQVFLLDNQREEEILNYEAEEKSHIFLIYPPQQLQEDAAIGEKNMSRVPFRSIVVGLMSHQILVQTVGSLLLQGSTNTVPMEKDFITSSASLIEGGIGCNVKSQGKDNSLNSDLIADEPLPGMMKYMSCRNILTLLDCLRSSFETATQFDLRPGLKFLMQKVGRSKVATNLYKQSCLSVLLYVHALLEVVTHHDNVHIENTKNLLLEARIEINLDKNTAGQVVNSEDNSNVNRKCDCDDVSVDKELESNVINNSDPSSSASSLKTTHNPLANNIVNTNTSNNNDNATSTESHPHGFKFPKSQIEFSRHSTAHVQKHMVVFMSRLSVILDDICGKYVDMYLEKEGPSPSDLLSKQLLVFLVAHEEVPTLKRKKSIKEMVMEKLREREKAESLEDGDGESVVSGGGDYSVGNILSSPVPLEEQCDIIEVDEAENDDEVFDNNKQHGTNNESGDTTVYEVATDKTIKSLMSEYKKRKQAKTMPTFVKQQQRRVTKKPSLEKQPSVDPVDRQIEEDQKHSLTRDQEAHLNSYIEMICFVLQLYQQLPDYQYQALLPTVFNFVNQMTCHCKHRRLRETLAQWSYRLGGLYQFSPIGGKPCPKAEYD